jgi:hypothetical protein
VLTHKLVLAYQLVPACASKEVETDVIKVGVSLGSSGRENDGCEDVVGCEVTSNLEVN